MSDERGRRVAVGVIALLVIALAIAANPLNLPVSILEQWMRRKLPPSSSIVAVRNAIEQERWETVDEWDAPAGFGVRVLLGQEWLPRRRYVYAFFVFDPFGRLVATSIQKSVNPVSVSGAPPDS